MCESRPFVVAYVPAFNEEKSIADVVVQSMRYMDRVVVCDDGSTDLTGEMAVGLGAVVSGTGTMYIWSYILFV